MRKLLFLATLATMMAPLAGCNTCRSMTGGWFNRGDRCNQCPPADCGPGGPRTLMLPPGPQMLPGAIDITPTS